MSAVVQHTAPPTDLIALAIESKADVGTLERLFALKERNDAALAKSAYFEALSAFQSEAPEIPRTKEVKKKNGELMYKYAPLEVVIKTLRPTMLKHGFSHRFETEPQPDGSVIVWCIAHHIAGHSERSPVHIPTFQGQATNAAQDAGSAITYGRRYSFLDVFGIGTANDDDDGASAGPENLARLLDSNTVAREWFASIACVKENFRDGGDISAAAEAYAEMPRHVVSALFIAPSKGGLFTTAERARAKDDKEFQSIVHQIRTDAGWYQRPENEV